MHLIVSFVALFLILGLLVFVHEFGHFIVAKLIGAKVEEFAFGFGPKLFGKKYRGTEYRINLIPLGGYVRIFGEGLTNDIETSSETVLQAWRENKLYEINDKKALEKKVRSIKNIKDSDRKDILAAALYRINSMKSPDSFLSKSIGKRVLVIVAGVFMNFVLAIFIFLLYLSLSGFQTDLVKIVDYRFLGTVDSVEERPFISNVYSQELRNSGVEGTLVWEVNGERIKSSEEFTTFLEDNKGKEASYKFLNDKGAFVDLSLVLNTEGIDTNFDKEIQDKIVIVSVSEDFPAKKSGIEPGSIILKLNNEETTSVDSFIDLLDVNAGKSIELRIIDANGEEKTVTVDLKQKVNADDPVLGAGLSQNTPIYFEFFHLDYSGGKPLSGFFHSINILGYQIKAIGELVAESFREKSIAPVASGVGSVVTVADQVNSLVKANNFLDLINLTGLVSVALAFMNILPIPLFDGGHLLFLIIEKIRGHRLSPAKEELISKISFIFIILLSVAIILKDIIVLDWVPRVFALFMGLFK